MLSGELDRHTECGNKWSPASVDEFNSTAEKYCRDVELGTTTSELILTAHQWNVVQH